MSRGLRKSRSEGPRFEPRPAPTRIPRLHASRGSRETSLMLTVGKSSLMDVRSCVPAAHPGNHIVPTRSPAHCGLTRLRIMNRYSRACDGSAARIATFEAMLPYMPYAASQGPSATIQQGTTVVFLSIVRTPTVKETPGKHLKAIGVPVSWEILKDQFRHDYAAIRNICAEFRGCLKEVLRYCPAARMCESPGG